MAVVAAGTPAPDFTLARHEGAPFTREDLRGRDDVPGLLPVRVLAGLHGPAERLQRGAAATSPSAARRSTASPATRSGPSRRSSEQLGIEIEQLSDFEPKGATCRAFGVLHPAGFPQRALVLIDARRRRALELRGAVAGRPARRQPALRRPGRPRAVKPPAAAAHADVALACAAPRRRARRAPAAAGTGVNRSCSPRPLPSWCCASAASCPSRRSAASASPGPASSAT